MTADNEFYEVAPYNPSVAMVIPPAVAAGSDDYINYAGPPTPTPPTIPNIVVDSNGQSWAYYGSAWHTLTTGSGSGGLSGTGSPQGVVTAAAGTTYLDTSANNFWVNSNGLINGWVELVGN